MQFFFHFSIHDLQYMSQSVKPTNGCVQSDTLACLHCIFMLRLSHWLPVITIQTHVGNTEAGYFH